MVLLWRQGYCTSFWRRLDSILQNNLCWSFFTAAVIDTKIVWDIATVMDPIATVPNLLAILFLRKEIKNWIQNTL